MSGGGGRGAYAARAQGNRNNLFTIGPTYTRPQLYWNIGFAAADYAKLLPWWAEVVRGSGTLLYAGEALYKAGDPAQPAAWRDPAELSRHLTLAAEHPEVRGHVFFAAREVTADPIGAMARVVADHYRQPAEPPS